MLKILKKTPVVLIALLVFSSVGCSQAKSVGTASSDSAAPKQNQTETVTQVVDASGIKVTVPKKIDRIVITCQGGTSQDVAIFGAADKIVAQPSMKGFPEFLKIYPKLKSVIDAGSFDAVNMEEIVKANPDMVLVGITSKKGNKQIADTGFPTYTMYIGMAGIDSLKKEFKQVGTLLGNEQKADELLKYWDQKMAYINSMISMVPADQKKSVLYTSKDLSSVSGKNVWGNDLITAAGGLNAAAEITDSSSKVNVEQVMKWNPDVSCWGLVSVAAAALPQRHLRGPCPRRQVNQPLQTPLQLQPPEPGR